MSSTRKKKLTIAFVSAEVVPFAKEGGLADVAGALPSAIAALGAEVEIFMPLYGNIDRAKYGIKPFDGPAIGVDMAGAHENALIHTGILPGGSVPVYFVANDDYFGRKGVYNDPATGKGFADNARRFIFFQKAVLAFLRSRDRKPDVVHCNDFHTALLPWYLKRDRLGIASLISIHNLGYQGIEQADVLALAEIPRDQFYAMSPFEFWGAVNMMKIGLVFSDVINTVSPTYAREIQSSAEYGNGLEGVLRDRAADLHGIVNGIDYDVWNPRTDSLIPHHFSEKDLSGKALNKAELLKRNNLPVPEGRVPLIGIIGRLADQKGFDILGQCLERILALDLQMVVLGTGQREYHEMFQRAAAAHPDKLAVNLAFDNALAHLIEAGSDMFLMPSRYEPCGLNQLYSLSYGTIPVVRTTGGLADTIIPWDAATGVGTGFRFDEYSADALYTCVAEAVSQFDDAKAWKKLVTNAMAADFSWRASADQYMDLYRRALAANGN